MKIRDLIDQKKKSDDYDEKYMKIEFDSNDKLLLNKMIQIPVMAIVVRGIFYQNNKFSQINVCIKYKNVII